MRRLLVLCWTALAVAACGSDDLVDEGGDCSGGKQCKPGLICEPVQQICVKQVVADARVPDARVADARTFDASTAADAGPDARQFDAGAALDTTITSGPTGTINVNTATYSFTCNQGSCTFECSLDTAAFTSCTSPTTLNGLAAGAHTFRVRASAGGMTDSTPASASFTVNLAGLATVITQNPSNPTNQTSATFAFECRQDGVVQNDCTFACVLDGGAPAACTTPRALTALAVTTHTFTVTASRGGNVATPATFMWTIDTAPPTVEITSGPTGDVVTGPNPTFTYQPSETAATFACTLDGNSVPCGPDTKSFAGLSAGPHTFTVTVTDLAGNPSAPASATFVVDNAGPVVTVSAPAGTSGPSGSLVFTVEDQSLPATTTCDFGQGAGAVPCESGFNYNALPAGPATVTIVATDAVGNSSTTTHTFTVVVMGPVVQIFTPSEGQALCSTGMTLLFDTVPADATGITYSCTANGAPFPCAEGGVPLSGVLQGGLNTIVVNATDSLNLTGTATVTVFVDNTRPQLTITSPLPDEIVCPTGTIRYLTSDTGVRGAITVTSCTITDGERTLQCVAENGVVQYEGLSDGFHTITLSARDSCGNTTLPNPQRRFDVDGVGPTLTAVDAVAGAENTGIATLSFTFNDAKNPVGGTTEAGLLLSSELPASLPADNFVAGSCTACTASGCNCSGLAAGTNRLAARGIDQCGNIGEWVTTNVDASFGPYAGHKVAIAHSYEDLEVPPPLEIVGNSAALPYAVRDAATPRPPRVLAFRTANVSQTAVDRVLQGIVAEVGNEGATWDPENPQHYTEFDDETLLGELLPGHDVLLVYNDGEVGDFGFTNIGFVWNFNEGAPLPPFLDAGGVAVGLADGYFSLYPTESIILAKPQEVPTTVVFRHYLDALDGDDFYIAQGLGDSYPQPVGRDCVDNFSSLQSGSTVFSAVTEEIIEGSVFSSCPAVTDNVFPQYEIVVGAPTRGLGDPSCVGVVIGPTTTGASLVGGTFSISVPMGQTPPTGTFTCQTGPSGDRIFESPYPMFPCVVDQATQTFSGTTFESGWRVDIHLVEPDNTDVARGNFATVTIDSQLTFFGVFADFDNDCIDRYTVFEPSPVPNCTPTNNERVWKSVTCTLFRDPDGTDAEPEVQVTQLTGADCGATAAENPADGFITQQSISKNWTSVVEATGPGTYRVVYTVEDWRGNRVTQQRTFFAGTTCVPTPQ